MGTGVDMHVYMHRGRNNRWSSVIVQTFGPNDHSSVDLLGQHLLHDVYRWPSKYFLVWLIVQTILNPYFDLCMHIR